MRIVMLVDLDAFFASVEQRDNPLLRGKPVVVCVYTRGGRSGAVATASYEARKLGIRSGMPLFQARSKATPETVFLPVNFDAYRKASKRVMQLLAENCGVLQQVGIDEAYLDVSNRCADFGEAELLANSIKDAVKQRVGITCSIGVASSKVVAKIAAGLRKPDGLVVVLPGREKSFLDDLPLKELPGAGRKALEKLEPLGVKTIGGLSKLPLPQLQQLFGKAQASWLHDASRGVDNRAVEPQGARKQIGKIRTLDSDSRDYAFLEKALFSLCAQVFEAASQRGGFRRVSVMVVMEGLQAKAKNKTLPQQCNSLEVLEKTAGELLREFLNSTDKNFRRIGVSVSGLEEADARQKTLSSF